MDLTFARVSQDSDLSFTMGVCEIIFFIYFDTAVGRHPPGRHPPRANTHSGQTPPTPLHAGIHTPSVDRRNDTRL